MAKPPLCPESSVAIVGYSYRMPGSIQSDDDFWQLLSKREIVQEPIAGRYGRGYQPIGGFSGPSRLASPYEGLIRGNREWLFDRRLFEMSHGEAVMADPQVRMLLTCAWETFEHAGWSLRDLYNSDTGVFVGAQVPAVGIRQAMSVPGPFDITSISLAMLANRISYHFNLMGPSTTYCTACSAGLAAMHAAMAALQCGDCEQAVVGSVNYLGAARVSASFKALGVISPEGKCNSFDANANGYIRSEGAFLFALKGLAAAERDGDRIYALVDATAVNAAGAADGSSGLAHGRYITAPTRHAQVEVMRRATARAGLSPGDFDYIEAHATGTVVGDRIEGNAIGEAFGGFDRETPLRIASVKSNVGHMEAAAFHTALLKVLLMMERRTFAPISRNFRVPNAEIDFDSCPMQVQTACEEFPDRPVVVGINSFGFGGANGHCVIREYRPERPRVWSSPAAPEGGFMVPLSARTPGALTESVERLRDALDELETHFQTLVGNLCRRRTHFPVRTSFAVRDRAELAAALEAFIDDPEPVASAQEGGGRIAMVFPGQGTQWAGCGKALYEADPVFRRTVDAIEEEWRRYSETSLREACFSTAQEELNEVQLAQPAIFMLQCALVELLKTWGVYADCVVGHSSGEVAAAYASGALSLAEATQLVYHRAILQQRVSGSGRMLAIDLDRSGVEELLSETGIDVRRDGDRRGQIEIACENSPANTVLCGKKEALRPLIAELDRRGLRNRLIPGNIAFHSSVMDPLRDDVMKVLDFLDDGTFDADVPMVSSVTGETTRRLDSAYWWSNIRQPVRFAAAMDTVRREYRPDVVLEVAPHSALQPVIAQCLEGSLSPAPACIPTLMQDRDVCLGFQETLGALFRANVELDFAAQYPQPEPIAHLLPGHPREEDVEGMGDNEALVRQGLYSHGPMVGRKVPCDHLRFEARLSEVDFPWLADHRVQHESIMPAAGYIELILQALEGVPVVFEVLEFLQPCPIGKTPVRLQTALYRVRTDPEEFTFTISSQTYERESESTVHCQGKVRRKSDEFAPDAPARLADIYESGFHPAHRMDGGEFYDQVEAFLGETFQYGPAFRNIRKIISDTGSGQWLFDVEVDEAIWAVAREEGYVLYPGLVDGGLQIFLRHLFHTPDFLGIPYRAKKVAFLHPPTSRRITCHIAEDAFERMQIDERGQVVAEIGEQSLGGIGFYDGATGQLFAHIGDYTSFQIDARWADLPNTKHKVRWQPKFVPLASEFRVRLSDDEPTPTGLIAALEQGDPGERYACCVVELAGSRDPDQTFLHDCLPHLSGGGTQAEFWLIGDSEDAARAYYNAFHRHEAALRFDNLDPAAESEPDMDAGLLRPAIAELLLLHAEAVTFGPAQWKLCHRLVVPGGLALVSHEEGAVIDAGTGWTTVRADSRSTLLQAPPDYGDFVAPTRSPGLRWVLGEGDSWASEWAALFDPSETHQVSGDLLAVGNFESLREWPGAADLQSIEFFCGRDPGDATGDRAASRLIRFLQALVPDRIENAARRCRLTVVTRDAALEVEDPRGSSLWGAIRSIGLEIMDEGAKLDLRLVDIQTPSDLETLARLDACDLRERELAIREQRLWAPRVVSIRDRFPSVPAGDDPSYRLHVDNPGQISGLLMKTCELPPPGPSEVEIEVVAAALNFRDAMVTLGLLPTMAYEHSALGHEVGIEASGIVREVGPNVDQLQVGDEVVFIKGGCIANRIVVDHFQVFRKPVGITLEDAAASLSVYVTAYYSLIHLARLHEGQRVLIHSAMGGVGQAAIALAKYVGAEVYATAGNESRRDQLRELGVLGAFDSHSHGWYDDLMDATGGEGVDVVLNSLSGHHISLCLEALRPSGWHCEIGKVDIYADNALSMRVFRKNLRFAAIDLDRLALDDPLLSRQLSKTCLDLLDQGAVPALPLTVFPYRAYDRALRLMTTGRHQGKLVLKAPADADDAGFPVADFRPYLDPDATYLITGGLGGLGLRLLSYLISAGARHLTLMDRDPDRRRSADWVRRASALLKLDQPHEIDIVVGDVGNDVDVRRCVEGIRRPLKGVFHLAGTLEDRTLIDITPESLDQVFAPKARGALNLHRATEHCPLDHFVLFSSVASTFGNAGQISYSAASAFLDGLASYRRHQGLPALSYNLTAVAEVGMASRDVNVMRTLRAIGMSPVSGNFAVANLDYALRSMGEEDHLVTALFSRAPWHVDSPDYTKNGRLIRNEDGFDIDAETHLTIGDVAAQISAKVTELCGHHEGGVDESLASFGLTSISIVELGAFIRTRFNYQVSAMELMVSASALSLAKAIVRGTGSAGKTPDKAETDGADDSLPVSRQWIRRTPSPFANALEDHFPDASTGSPNGDSADMRQFTDGLYCGEESHVARSAPRRTSRVDSRHR
jgi:acyl transferase domain-containing protein/NADPH:quinone reductase-like Zn-dependent oxidoreductase